MRTRLNKIFCKSASVLLLAVGVVFFAPPAYSQYRALWYTNGDTTYPIQALYLKVPHILGSTVWGQIDSIPPALDSLVSPATGSGLYLDSTHLGYHSGGVWKTYMDNKGDFYLGGPSGALQWNGTTLTISASLSGNGGGVTNINGGNIQTGTITASQISSGYVYAGAINADQITAGLITGSQIAGGTITATQIADSTITAAQISSGYVYAGSINANQISATSLSAISANLGTVTAGSLTGVTITSATMSGNGGGITNINGGNIQTGTITASQISSGYVYAGTINASQISATSLSAISANLGTVTAGSITGVTIQTSNSGNQVVIGSDEIQCNYGGVGVSGGIIKGSATGLSIVGGGSAASISLSTSGSTAAINMSSGNINLTTTFGASVTENGQAIPRWWGYLSAAPSSGMVEGDMYYNSVLPGLMVYSNGAWRTP